MIFSSIPFLVFLAIVYLLVFVTMKTTESRNYTKWILLISSFVFYSWWNPAIIILLIISITVNFGISKLIIRDTQKFKPIYIAGIIFNIALIAYYKYAYFLIDIINGITSMDIQIRDDIFLPMGISFLTFQQIAYLIDCYKGKSGDYNFRDYALFISFFPQLIAGPIVHHKEMMPQFESKINKFITWENFTIGFALLTMGFFKKLVIADNAALISSPFFIKAAGQQSINFISSWTGVMAYTFQIYFDFSGYCDMALGVARMFGIILPINFFSPYKSRNISDFWRVWHITLSRFLRDYVYIPLGGNRKGKFRRYVNLMATMLVGGLWHGASWTFVVWGGLHGLYLVIHQGWTHFRTNVLTFGSSNKIMQGFGSLLAMLVTFISVVFAWVFFEAKTFDSAIRICKAMMGSEGLGKWNGNGQLYFLTKTEYTGLLKIFTDDIPRNVNTLAAFEHIGFLALVAILVWFIPNTIQVARNFNPVIDPSKILSSYSKQFGGLPMTLKPNIIWAIVLSVAFVYSILNMTKISPFLYFQF